MDDKQQANALGWFGLGLGSLAVISARGLAQAIGISGSPTQCAVVRAVGLREIASGIGILTSTQPAPWLWGRVAGDAMDLALLSRTMALPEADRGRIGLAMGAVAGIAVLDVLCTMRFSRSPAVIAGYGFIGRAEEDQAMEVKQAITINRPPAELYQFWHRFENLPQFMSHLKSVQTNGDGRSHWAATAPAGTTVEWDAEVVEDRPNELIAWHSLPNAAVDNAGLVRFTPAPGNRGTEVHVEMRYDPPAGAVGAAVAKLFGEEPSQQIHDDLRHLKQVMETGEVARSDASARGGGPAQPTAESATH